MSPSPKKPQHLHNHRATLVTTHDEVEEEYEYEYRGDAAAAAAAATAAAATAAATAGFALVAPAAGRGAPHLPLGLAERREPAFGRLVRERRHEAVEAPDANPVEGGGGPGSPVVGAAVGAGHARRRVDVVVEAAEARHGWGFPALSHV